MPTKQLLVKLIPVLGLFEKILAEISKTTNSPHFLPPRNAACGSLSEVRQVG